MTLNDLECHNSPYFASFHTLPTLQLGLSAIAELLVVYLYGVLVL